MYTQTDCQQSLPMILSCISRFTDFCRQSSRKISPNFSFMRNSFCRFPKLYSTDIAVERALKEYVWLKNGAYLVIQPTEALTVVDVNSGKYSAKTKKEKCGNVFKDQSGSGKGNSTADPPAQYFRNYPD